MMKQRACRNLHACHKALAGWQQPGGESQPAAPVPIQKSGPKVGRNDPCPCAEAGKNIKNAAVDN